MKPHLHSGEVSWYEEEGANSFRLLLQVDQAFRLKLEWHNISMVGIFLVLHLYTRSFSEAVDN